MTTSAHDIERAVPSMYAALPNARDRLLVRPPDRRSPQDSEQTWRPLRRNGRRSRRNRPKSSRSCVATIALAAKPASSSALSTASISSCRKITRSRRKCSSTSRPASAVCSAPAIVRGTLSTWCNESPSSRPATWSSPSQAGADAHPSRLTCAPDPKSGNYRPQSRSAAALRLYRHAERRLARANSSLRESDRSTFPAVGRRAAAC